MFVDNRVHEGQQEMKHFISPDLWLPKSSSVLDQVDCQIWRLMQERVYRTPIHNSRDLKQRPTDTPASVSQNVIDEAVDQLRKWLHVCGEKEHHFERLLN